MGQTKTNDIKRTPHFGCFCKPFARRALQRIYNEVGLCPPLAPRILLAPWLQSVALDPIESTSAQAELDLPVLTQVEDHKAKRTVKKEKEDLQRSRRKDAALHHATLSQGIDDKSCHF